MGVVVVVGIRLLGGVDATVDRRAAAIGHTRQQHVFAALAIDVNTVVPVDELVDRVWGDRPPQRATGTLQSYLTRLRAAGLTIARRTVTKYRKALRIPSSRQRKDWSLVV